MRREDSEGVVSRRGGRAIAEARGGDEFSFRRIKLKASYRFLRLLMTLQMIADVGRIEQMKFGFKKFNPIRINNDKN